MQPVQMSGTFSNQDRMQRTAVSWNIQTIHPYILGLILPFLSGADYLRFTSTSKQFGRLRSIEEKITDQHPVKNLRCIEKLQFRSRKKFAKLIKSIAEAYSPDIAPLSESFRLKGLEIKRAIDLSERNYAIKSTLKPSEGKLYQYYTKGFKRLNQLTLQGNGVQHCFSVFSQMDELTTLTIVKVDKQAIMHLSNHFPKNLEKLEIDQLYDENLSASVFDEESVNYFAEALGRSRLTWLNLRQLDIGKEKMLQIIEKMPSSLHHLSTHFAGIEDTAVSLLCTRLPQLSHLDLEVNGVNPEGLASMINSSFVQNLTYLNLAHNHVGEEGCALLAGSEWKRLKYLNLVGSQIKEEGLALIASGRNFPALRELDLGFTHLGLSGEPFRGRIGLFENLEVLHLPYTGLQPSGFRAVINSVKAIQKLNISMNRLLERNLIAPIINDPKFSSLKSLNLADYTLLTGQEALALLRAPHLRELEELDIKDSAIGLIEEGEEHSYFASQLKNITTLNKLSYLNICSNTFKRCDTRQILDFSNRFSKVRIYYSFPND